MSNTSVEHTSPDDPQTAALDAFVKFTEATNTVLDPAALFDLAVDIHASAYVPTDPPTFVTAVYALEDQLWKLRVLRGYAPLASIRFAQAGLPLDIQPIARATTEQRPIFSVWDAEDSSIPDTGMWHTTGIYPLVRQGQSVGYFSFGLAGAQVLTERDQQVFLALGRALQLGLERAWHAEAERAELIQLRRRHQALEAFVALGRDPSFASDPVAVIRHTVRLLHLLLPQSFVRYWSHEGQRWAVQTEAGQPPSGGLLERLPKPGGDLQPITLAPRQDTERQPVYLQDELIGMLEVTLQNTSGWTAPERAVLETLAQHLGLALERAGQDQHQPQEVTEAVQSARADLLAFDEALWTDLRQELAQLAVDDEAARDRLAHLQTQLDGLLNYAERLRQPLTLTPVDLARLAESVQREVMRERLQHQVDWHWGRLPVVTGDRELLRVVLRELFLNVLRATEHRQGARIEVWGERRAEGWVVSVRDNGLGFNPAFAPHVFDAGGQVFSDEDASLGLMTVRQLIERLGGTVGAEGHPGKGQTLMVSLPEP